MNNYQVFVEHERCADIQAESLDIAIMQTRAHYKYATLIHVKYHGEDEDEAVMTLEWSLKPGRCGAHPTERFDPTNYCAECQRD